MLLCAALVFGMNITPAYAETTHPIKIEWYYGTASQMSNFYNGETGTKLGSKSLTAENGLFDYSEYAKDPDGANFYMMYGVSPIIRINGNYYLLNYIYVEANSPQDQVNFTIDLNDSDTDVVIRLGYIKVRLNTPQKLDKIKISIDNSANENLIENHTYEAYQIFHVTKADSVEEDVTTDDTIGQPIGSEDEGFCYYIKTTDEWYNVISNMTDWFELTPSVDGTIYYVTLKDNIEASESTAIAIANELEQYTEGKTAIEIVSGTARLDIDPGYYLIVSPINTNLILATTNIDITEKAMYPSIEKTVAAKDENAAIGS